MNWGAIGAVGEITGAVAVVISIIYLARQVSHSNLTAQADTTFDVSKAVAEWHRGINQTPDLAEIWFKGMADEDSLNSQERARFTILNAEFFILLEGLYRQYQLGFVKTEAWQPIERLIMRFFSSASFSEWWDSGVSANGDDFRAYVSGLRKQSQPEGWTKTMRSFSSDKTEQSAT